MLATVNQSDCELHLIDTTGIIKCRAYAIGKYSSQINKHLLKKQFRDLSVEEGAQLLLDIIRECSVGNSNDNSSDDDINMLRKSEEDDEGGDDSWQMPLGTCAEIAVLDLSRRQIRRLRQPLLTQLSTS